MSKKIEKKEKVEKMKKDLSQVIMILQKASKDLQNQTEESFVCAVAILCEIAALKGGYIQSGDTDKSFRDSGQYNLMRANNEVEEAMNHLKKAIFFVKEVGKQSKKRLSPKKKKEEKNN